MRGLPRFPNMKDERAGVAGGRRPLRAVSFPRELARLPFGHTSHEAYCGTLDRNFVHRATIEDEALFVLLMESVQLRF